MIGFELTATGSNGFSQRRANWTEGSLIALRAVLKHCRGSKYFSKVQQAALTSVEADFKKIADSRLQQVCSLGMDFTLTLSRDVELTYHFTGRKDWEQTRSEFLDALEARTGKLGDQVMIHLCAIIQDFALHNLTRQGRPLRLTVDVDL